MLLFHRVNHRYIHRRLYHAVLFSSVWPEWRSSAAGVRSLALMKALRHDGHSVTCVSSARSTKFREELSELYGICTAQISLNSTSEFDSWASEIVVPSVAIFDTFVSEEMWSWRVRKAFPDTVLINDTQDLRFVRTTRQQKVQEQSPAVLADCTLDVQDCVASKLTLMLRELSSIQRSDLSLLTSTFEIDFLVNHLSVKSDKLCLASFFYRREGAVKRPFEERTNFVTIGHFQHPPNRDSYDVLKRVVWPKIRERIPNATLTIIGAHSSHADDMYLHNPSEGLFVEGYVDDAVKALSSYRVALAPLRFGAGIKGKISDCWQAGVPVVTTSIGAEGMNYDVGGDRWDGGVVADSVDDFVKAAVNLYTNQRSWEACESGARSLLQSLFNHDRNTRNILSAINGVVDKCSERRTQDFVQAMLWQESLLSKRYLSLYIEQKQKTNKMT